jgi:hypothetical protein
LTAPEARAGDVGSGGAEGSRPGSAGTVGKTELTSGVRLSEKRGGGGRWAGWARGQAGHGVGRAKNQKKEIFELKIRFLNLSRLCKFVEGDLEGILT